MIGRIVDGGWNSGGGAAKPQYRSHFAVNWLAISVTALDIRGIVIGYRQAAAVCMLRYSDYSENISSEPINLRQMIAVQDRGRRDK
jgi:hypothetical protein